MIVVQVLTRLLAFVGKELVEVVRRPGALFSLVLGPFLIMGLFGIGYNGIRQPLRAVVVVPPSTGLSTDPAVYSRLEQPGVVLAGVLTDEVEARQELLAGRADLVVVAPSNVSATFRSGRQSVIRVEYDTVDPIKASYATVAGNQICDAVDREIIRRGAAQGEGYAVAQGATGAGAIPPAVISQPTRPEVENLSPTPAGVMVFFGPAVVALILQHLALTLVALSLVKERTSGIAELFRISPITPLEVIVGKLLAFSVLGGVIALATVGVLVVGFGVPMLADPWVVAAIIALLIVASTGVGLLIAVVSGSESQAVQLALFVLLASVFFSGLILPVAEFVQPVRTLAYLLPVTNAITLLQDLMLQGRTNVWWEAGALAAIAGTTLLLSWMLLRRSLGRA